MVFNTTFSYMVAVSIIGGRRDIAEILLKVALSTINKIKLNKSSWI